MNAFAMPSLRKIWGAGLADPIRNQEIYGMAATNEDIRVRMEKNVIRFEHVLRMDD